ncbi:hypothetical protein [Comamonas sp. GB3 AK4-5]|uniref:hypothetical protein n=1 Tax=Comamonas sp. GB3 AK4-5 TaxID=3231487 RepID=UPI00351EF8BE
MNADQVIEGIGKAIVAVSPAQEYCALWIDSWATCMTKSEWSGWVQAIGSVLAICAAVWVFSLQQRAEHNRHRADAASILSSFIGTLDTIQRLIPADGNRSVWTVIKVRVLIEAELQRVGGLEMHALVLNEQVGVFNYRMAAMQLIEALRVVEGDIDKTEKGVFVHQEAYVFLQGVIVEAMELMRKGRPLFGSWIKG